MGDGEAWQILANDKRVYLGVGRADLYQPLAKHLSRQKISAPYQPGCPSGQFGGEDGNLLENGRSVHADEIIGADGAMVRVVLLPVPGLAARLPIMRCAHRYCRSSAAPVFPVKTR